MISTANSNKNKVISTISAILLGVALLIGLQGCSSSGGDELVVVVDADPTGYYTGTADVKPDANTDLRIDDLQGMINGSRFMVMSVANTLLYDGTITDVTANDFSANVTIYKDGLVASTTTMSGTITEGSQITGTIAGTDAFNGTFTIVYAQSNSEPSAISKVENIPGEVWSGQIGPTTDQMFQINNSGAVINIDESSDGVFAGCTITGASIISPIPNTRLYNVSLEFISCSGSNYTGLATTKSVGSTDDVLVFTYTDGALAASADYVLAPDPLP
jgi:hypothetical protein